MTTVERLWPGGEAPTQPHRMPPPRRPARGAAGSGRHERFGTDDDLVARPLWLARRFADRLGLAEPASAIVPLVVGDASRALEAQRKLEDDGFLVVAIRPPTVPDGTARLRLSFSAAHPDAEIARLEDTVLRLAVPALIFAVPVLFAGEIRRALEQLGRAGSLLPRAGATSPSITPPLRRRPSAWVRRWARPLRVPARSGRAQRRTPVSYNHLTLPTIYLV